jgi:hypothetical protein
MQQPPGAHNKHLGFDLNRQPLPAHKNSAEWVAAACAALLAHGRELSRQNGTRSTEMDLKKCVRVSWAGFVRIILC